MVNPYEKPFFVLALVLCGALALAYGFLRFVGDPMTGPPWVRWLVFLIVGLSAIGGRHAGGLGQDHAFRSTTARVSLARTCCLWTAVVLLMDSAGLFDRWVPGSGDGSPRLARIVFGAWLLISMLGAVATALGRGRLLGSRDAVDEPEVADSE